MDEDELNAHLWSWRLSSRECPQTPGIWEYRDNFDVVFKHQVDRAKHLKGAQEVHDDEAFDALFEGIEHLLEDRSDKILELADAFESGKGKGKGKDNAVCIFAGKGKGRGKGKNPPGLPDPKPDKDPLELAISKCKQAMLLIEKTSMALDDDMAAVSKSKYMNPKLKTTFLAFMAKLSQAKNKLKANMNKAAQLDLETFKTMITNGVAVVKEIQSFMKEHKAISSGASAMGKDD